MNKNLWNIPRNAGKNSNEKNQGMILSMYFQMHFHWNGKKGKPMAIVESLSLMTAAFQGLCIYRRRAHE